MAEYVCVDGPLSGQQFDWRDEPHEGEVLTIGLVDVAQGDVGPDETEADYRVLSRGGAGGSAPGRLAFVAGRGAWCADAVLVPG